jgi:hypothetical protein
LENARHDSWQQIFKRRLFNPNTRLEHVTVNGTDLMIGHRVQIRPQGRADVMDLALEGKIAVIESIEQDAENRVYLALVLDEDPGKDLGMLRQPGHRFFYGLNEIEPLTGPQWADQAKSWSPVSATSFWATTLLAAKWRAN